MKPVGGGLWLLVLLLPLLPPLRPLLLLLRLLLQTRRGAGLRDETRRGRIVVTSITPITITVGGTFWGRLGGAK